MFATLSYMSGHSKWTQIKRKKAAADVKKGAVFTRLSQNITLAAREGGDPETNFKLRLAVEQARDASLPKENIERAIKRGTGELGGGNLTEVTYEGYGPGGSQIIIKAVTDNVNRTVSELRHILDKSGGSLGSAGAVMWNFTEKGVARVLKGGVGKDEIELAAIEAGADDIQDEEDGLTILTAVKNLHALKNSLETKGFKIESADIEYVPKTTAELNEADRQKFETLTQELEDCEDVHDYYTNVE